MLALRLQPSLHQVMARGKPHVGHNASRMTEQCEGLWELQEKSPRLIASQEGMLSGNLISSVDVLAPRVCAPAHTIAMV